MAPFDSLCIILYCNYIPVLYCFNISTNITSPCSNDQFCDFNTISDHDRQTDIIAISVLRSAQLCYLRQDKTSGQNNLT